MTAPPDTAEIFAELLRRSRLPLSREKETQTALEQMLQLNGTDYSREHRLGPGDVVDFFLPPDLAIEIKMNLSRWTATFKQLTRYAECDQVKTIILLTNRAMPLPPRFANGKRLIQVSLGRAWL